MYCLYNGEYGEHDLSHICGIEKICENQKEHYKDYIGTVVGDFTVLKVEYDWGKRTQRWEVECNFCHRREYLYNSCDWRRGKGKSTSCKCREIRDNLDKILEPEKPKKIFNDDPGWVGQVMNGYRITGYDNSGYFLVECLECGKKRKMPCGKFRIGKITPCNHRIINNYSGEEWIGKRNGHLTTLSRTGGLFECKCDCGNIVKVRGTDLFHSKNATTCRHKECPYYNATKLTYRESIRRNGLDYEHKAVALFRDKGYIVEHTPDQGDFGVDFIVILPDNHKMAIQCKKKKSPTGVSAVQEVYAGGRYYDCDRFSVISPSGFSFNAILLAQKLGVYLAVHTFSFEETIQENTTSLLETMPSIDNKSKVNKRCTLWTLHGVTKTAKEWCREYNISRDTINRRLAKGMTLEEALNSPKHGQEIFEVDGVKGTIRELANRFGMLPETVRWRMKYCEMSLSEALTTEGRCTKHLPQEVAL